MLLHMRGTRAVKLSLYMYMGVLRKTIKRGQLPMLRLILPVSSPAEYSACVPEHDAMYVMVAKIPISLKVSVCYSVKFAK